MLDRLDKDVTVDKEAVFCAEGAANNMIGCVVRPGRVCHIGGTGILRERKLVAGSRQTNRSSLLTLMRHQGVHATLGII